MAIHSKGVGMSFNQKALGRVGSGVSESSAIWSYATADTQGAVESDGYFSESTLIKVKDYIIILGESFSSTYRVLSLNPTVITSTDAGAGLKNVRYITNESDISDWLESAPEPFQTDYPGAQVYRIPSGWKVLATGGAYVSMSHPFYPEDNCTVVSANSPLIDGFDFTGATYPYAFFCDSAEVGNLFTCTGILTFYLCDSRGNYTWQDDGSFLAAILGGSFDDITRVRWTGVTLAGQSAPFDFTTAINDSINLINVETSDNVFAQTAGHMFDLTSATAGNRVVKTFNCIQNAFSDNSSLIKVLDDTTIQNGAITSCSLNKIGGAGTNKDFVSGIDSASIRTTFSANSSGIKNTRPGGVIEIEGNNTATVNPGIGVYATPAGTTTLSPNAIRVSHPANYSIEWDGIESEDMYAQLSVGLRQTSGGSHDYLVSVFKNASVTPEFSATVTTNGAGNIRSGSSFSTIEAETGDVFSVKIVCLTSSNDYVVDNLNFGLLIGGN